MGFYIAMFDCQRATNGILQVSTTFSDPADQPSHFREKGRTKVVSKRPARHDLAIAHHFSKASYASPGPWTSGLPKQEKQPNGSIPVNTFFWGDEHPQIPAIFMLT